MSIQQALATSELLDTIVELASSDTQVTAAQVCRSWSNHAIRHIWRELPSIVPLLELLAPLQKDKNGKSRSYSRDISYRDWERLQLYGAHVRSIAQDDTARYRSRHVIMSERVFAQLAAQGMGRPHFLPNIRKLQWTIQHSSSITGVSFFASHSLEDLKLFFRIHEELPQALQSLCGRIPNIKKFTLMVPPGTLSNSTDVSIAELLRGASGLEDVALPPFFLSRPIINALATLPDLNSLVHSDYLAARYHYDDYGCQFDFCSQRLLKLKSLDFYMELEGAHLVFQNELTPRNLVSLHLGARHFDGGQALHAFLEVLVSSNHSITTLTLDLYTHSKDLCTTNLTFEHITPLLLLNLKKFVIKHDNPLQFSDSDIKVMGGAWPKMSQLSLNSEPLVLDHAQPPPGCSVLSLPTFATHFPVLKRLGVYLQILPQPQVLLRGERFRQLKALSVGTSILNAQDTKDIAVFFAYLIPRGKPNAHYSGLYPKQADGHRRNMTWNKALEQFETYTDAQQHLQSDLEDYTEKLEVMRVEKARLQEENIALKEENSQMKQQIRSDGQRQALMEKDERESLCSLNR